MTITLTVNGRRYSSQKTGHTLLTYLREELGLTAVKNGCAEGHCGACTVIIDGQAELACMKQLADLNGSEVTTLESLSSDYALHPLQAAFIQEGAIQCGFCTPGMIMAAKALLDRNPEPGDVEITRALARNLCRCTGYVKIIKAIRTAGAYLRKGIKAVPISDLYTETQHPLGRPVPRVDALAKVTGRLKFSDDLRFDNTLYAAVLRSEHCHAEILSIDTTAAQALEAVRMVLTAEDVPGRNAFGLIVQDQPVLSGDRVRYVGDAVAAVVADTPEAAREALDKIEVKYKTLPVISNPQEAMAANAPLIHDSDSNVFAHMESGRGDIERGFGEAAHIIEDDYFTPFIEHAYLEPESGTAVPKGDGRISIYVGSQGPPDDIRQIASALALPEEKIHIAHRPPGGGFGGKEDITVQIIVALAAMKTSRPVKLTFSRRESIRTSIKRHAHYLHYKTGVRADGTICVVQAGIVSDSGAYASAGEAIILRAVSFAAGPYTIPNVDIKADAVYTNNVPCGAMRGFGNPPVTFASEIQLNRLAEKLGLDPFEIRLRNILEEDKPSITGERIRYSVGAKACLLAVRDALGRYDPPQPQPGWKLGTGIACSYKNVGLGIGMDDYGSAYGEISEDGILTVRVGSVDMGQGSDTVMAQLASEVLGWPFGKVRVSSGDSERDPWGGMTTASRQTFVTGNAVHRMALQLKDKLFRYLSEKFKVSEADLGIRGEYFVNRNTKDPLCSLKELSEQLRREDRRISAEVRYSAPETRFALKEPSSGYKPGEDRLHVAYCFAAQAVILEVNPDSGRVKVHKVIAASDTGTIMNPQAVEGQIEGGVVMGLGYALTEEFKLDRGRIVTDTLAKLGLWRIGQIPQIECLSIENPHIEGPYGAKGMGELPISPTAPAVISALHDALGVWITSLPATPERIREALKLNRT